jgi:hypothetical protein
LNVYAFVGNQALFLIDVNGLSTSNCVTISKNYTIDLGSWRVGAPVGWISISGGQSISLSMSGEKCDECCSDGSTKEIKTGTWSATFSGNLSITGGPQFAGNVPGTNYGVSGFIGIQGTLSGSGGGSTSFSKGGCSNENSGSGTVNFELSGSLSGGGNLSASIGMLEFDVASATVSGSLSQGYSATLDCDDVECSVSNVKPDNGWQKSASADICAFGICGTWKLL